MYLPRVLMKTQIKGQNDVKDQMKDQIGPLILN